MNNNIYCARITEILKIILNICHMWGQKRQTILSVNKDVEQWVLQKLLVRI